LFCDIVVCGVCRAAALYAQWCASRRSIYVSGMLGGSALGLKHSGSGMARAPATDT